MPDFKLVEKPEWGPLVTFIPNKEQPVYNWFYYKEGFAKELVLRLAHELSLTNGWKASMAGRRQQTPSIEMTPSDQRVRVLDPFCGVGTTLLACKQLGLDSIGFDVNPMAVFAAKVKTRDYSTEDMREAIIGLFKAKHTPVSVPESRLLKKFFPPRTLKETVFYRDTIGTIRDIHIRDFLLLGLMSVAMKCSFAYKDGAVLKVKKKPVPPVRDMLRRQLSHMLRDYESMKTEECETTAEFGDARSLPLEDSTVDAVITSPPYLNKIEYTRIYEIEQEIFLKRIQEGPSIRSYIGLSLGKLEKDMALLEAALDYESVKGLPSEALPYLTDMFQSIEELYRVCRKGAKLALVVGNGCFPTGVVESDILLSRMAESLGFQVDKILVLNKRWCTRNRTEKVGIARESLLLWKKP